ncbi:MAG TPA: HPr family phosphocarrier protein [Candidatus Caccovicinus merdipullorum]|uniref:HPr family phosphocarrier protein n=1 Tax=Candidatus Caccovicinus merdipullorum TaxID=2840724 RepID=A0A9D1GHY2_9FIRM|nr:HPr family phosphocarrier protein [Candidatus Caccovicinus merdipullorum]
MDYRIRDEQGLHVRPISKIVFTLMKYNCRVQVKGRQGAADGKDMMELLALNAGKGEMICFIFEGAEEKAASEALEKLLSEIGL